MARHDIDIYCLLSFFTWTNLNIFSTVHRGRGGNTPNRASTVAIAMAMAAFHAMAHLAVFTIRWECSGSDATHHCMRVAAICFFFLFMASVQTFGAPLLAAPALPALLAAKPVRLPRMQQLPRMQLLRLHGCLHTPHAIVAPTRPHAVRVSAYAHAGEYLRLPCM
jgi:hypothetical protein